MATTSVKTCVRCGERPVHVYKKTGRQHSYCVPCLNAPGESKRRFLAVVKATCGCVDCGTREGRLDFDHRPGTVKLFNLGHPRCSWVRLLNELAKCDVRCASCHTARHARDKSGPFALRGRHA
jgi:hypothetical protein